MSDYRACPGCDKQLKRLTSEPEKYRKHTVMGRPEPCDFAGTEVVKEEEWQQGSKSSAPSPIASCAPSPEEDATTGATPATSSTNSSPPSPDTADDATSTASPDATPAIPGVEEYVTVLDAMSTEQRAAFRASVDATLAKSDIFSQPAPPIPEQAVLFSQPAGRASEAPALEMGDLSKEITARFKEIFYAYQNRKTSDNRSAQATMGPSGMGSPCDRRLAVELLRLPPVNPGGDGFAAWVGTCMHAGLEEIFKWADAGSGRFATESRVEFDSKYVPKGTADLLDRTLFCLEDFKCQGRWSRNKLKSQGPSQTYRVQAHVYAFGARQRGEKVDHVAIVSVPRDEATLDDLYVWSEPYRPDIVKEAFERVERIGAQSELRFIEIRETYPDVHEDEVKARVVSEFDVADDCRFCKAYMPGARSILDGCNGKR